MDFLLNKSIKVLNIKPYIFITIIFPVLLVGCGGGSSSDTQTSTNQSDPVQSTENVTGTYYTVDSEDLSYREIKLFNNVSPNTDYSTRLSSDEYLLTETNLYTNTWVKADFRAINSTKFYFSDAPGVGYYQTIKAVDVSGEDVFDRVSPGVREFYSQIEVSENGKEQPLYQLYTLNPTTKFPQGSICYQVTNQTPIKAHITFDKSDITDENYTDVIKNYENNFKEVAFNKGLTFSVVSGNWNGKDWKYFKASNQYGLFYSQLILNYNGKVVRGLMNNLDGFDTSQEITRIKASMPQISDYYLPYYKRYLAELTSGCVWFNETAFEATRQLVNN